jgi:putative transposase
MARRKPIISVGEIYHIFNRGVDKQNIFLSDDDYIRFLYLILHAQSPLPLTNVSKAVKPFRLSKKFRSRQSWRETIIGKRTVELISFCLMPNHFHLIVKEKKPNGITNYLHHVESAYAKYFNIKYKRAGHLFESKFKAVHVTSNTQLLHLSAYIHKNPRDLSSWRHNLLAYPYSSYFDYTANNRFERLLETTIIIDQFPDGKNGYKKFVASSTAKERERLLEAGHLL